MVLFCFFNPTVFFRLNLVLYYSTSWEFLRQLLMTNASTTSGENVVRSLLSPSKWYDLGGQLYRKFYLQTVVSCTPQQGDAPDIPERFQKTTLSLWALPIISRRCKGTVITETHSETKPRVYQLCAGGRRVSHSLWQSLVYWMCYNSGEKWTEHMYARY